MKVYKLLVFSKFVKRQKISDMDLKKAIEDAEKGIIGADLGGNVIKQRIARPKQGKSAGYRTIIIFKKGDKAFFVHGFAKSDSDNITKKEEKFYKDAARIYLKLTDEQIEKAIKAGKFTEI